MPTTLRTKLNQEQYAAAEKAAVERRTAPARARIAAMEKQIEEEIAANMKQTYGGPLERLEDRVRNADRWMEQLIDEGIEFTKYDVAEREETLKLESPWARELSACNEMYRQIAADTGLLPTREAKARFWAYVVVHSHVLQADFTKQTNLRKAWNRLHSIGVFPAEEIVFDASKKVVRPEPPKPPAPEPEDHKAGANTRIDDRTRQERQEVFRDMLKEAEPLVLEFIKFVRDTYHTPFGDDEKLRLTNYLWQKGVGISVKTLNDARRYLGYKTPDEELGDAISNAKKPLTDYENHRNITQAQAAVSQLPAGVVNPKYKPEV